MKQFFFILLSVSILFYSCGTKKQVVSTVPKTQNPNTEVQQIEPSAPLPEVTIKDKPAVISNPTEAYITVFSPIAKEEMKLYKIPASITLAQGILESQSSQSRLAVEANNHFGIKCHNWTGATIYHDDDEKGECFRKYNNAKYSYRDHSLFLTERKRYSKLFELPIEDYKAWAQELKNAGYATDKQYPQKLISLIERYQLYRFDTEVSGISPISNANHIVVLGDTLYGISKKYNINIDELKQLNNLNDSTIFVGQILYLKPTPK